MSTESNIQLVLSEGESYKVEFKERIANLDREIVAFANAAGGSIYIGIKDNNEIIGIDINNRLKSQIQDIARNCDPSIKIQLITHKSHSILEVNVAEGQDKPYRCKDGFFLRIGSSAQKLRRNEIVQLINGSNKIRFDEKINSHFLYPDDFSKTQLKLYLEVCDIKSLVNSKDILISLGTGEFDNKHFMLNNAGVFFFAKKPQNFLPESYITCVKYQSHDRFSIIDKKDFFGSPIAQIEDTLKFIINHMSVETIIGSLKTERVGQSQKFYDYPIAALREAVVNAVTHRDYNYDSSHIYVHMYPDRIEIENPGGLHHGLTESNLGQRSVRRNRLIADLLHRADYIERAGTGFDRITHALKQNNNPAMEISATNFFNIRFYKRMNTAIELKLNSRQQSIYTLIKERKSITKREAAQYLNVSDDTALRDLKALENEKLIKRVGIGKSTSYIPL